MSHNETDYEFRKTEDGSWERVQTEKQGGKDAQEIINEYRGILRRIDKTEEDLSDLLSRKKALDPVIDEIKEDLDEAARHQLEQIEDEKEQDDLKQAYNELRLALKEIDRLEDNED